MHKKVKFKKPKEDDDDYLDDEDENDLDDDVLIDKGIKYHSYNESYYADEYDLYEDED